MNDNKSNVAVWEDQKGMFRIKDPAKLAEMWGEKRNRTNMTYEKLSRSLRHYYEKKILRKVPKRKYTYKFNSREILKSYEVQPFYRRNSASQSHRQAKVSTPSSGQSSPYTPITPSPSYLDSNTHFYWPQPTNYLQPAWTTTPETTQISYNQTMTNVYYQPQHQQMSVAPQDRCMSWPTRNQDQFTYQIPQSSTLYQQAPHTPRTPTCISRCTYIENPAYPTDMPPSMPNSSCSFSSPRNLDRKPTIHHHASQLENVVSHPKPTLPLTLNIPSGDTSAVYDQMGRQTFCNQSSYSTNDRYCRSDSYSSYTSCDNTSPESFFESDQIFNDIMESLAMEAF